jgi:hypothetical protein
MENYLYRYIDHCTVSEDPYGKLYSNVHKPSILTYEILKTTPKGYWIAYRGSEKWISNYSKKRFAYPTKEEALESFKYRKKRQIRILKSQLRVANESLIKSEEIKI